MRWSGRGEGWVGFNVDDFEIVWDSAVCADV